MGLCSCAGEGVEKAWELACDLHAENFEKLTVFESPKYSEKLVACAPKISAQRNSKISYCGKILLAALREALSNADLSSADPERMGVYFGTSIGGIFETEQAIKNNLAENDIFKNLRQLAFYECSTLAEIVAKRTGARGECATFSTACSSSGLAIAAACEAIEEGVIDTAIVCGADSLSRMTVNGFGSLLLLSKGACAPFDKFRDGINLGEAAGVLILMSADFAEKSGNKILAKISGHACTADAHHPTAPHPDGDGAARAMGDALKSAGLNASEIDYINAHGTGTRGNDSAEAEAIKKIFGKNPPAFSSVKNTFAHTLGASGIVNAAMCVQALLHGKIPPNKGFENFDDSINLRPYCQTENVDLQNVISISLGFGGNNAAIVFSKNADKFECVGKKDLFIFGASAICATPEEKGLCDISRLLPNLPPLKKRKFAKLQQMALHTAQQALKSLSIKVAPEKIGVCFGTGMGMCAETARFIENTIIKSEAEPLPTAFTNSVHNAMSSAIAVQKNFKALNSAVTAKEVSFESALIQAWRAINADKLKSAVVGAADERTEYAQAFLKNFAQFSDEKFFVSDVAASYFIGTADSCEEKPFAKIIALDIRRKEFYAEKEFEKLLEKLKSEKIEIEKISEIFLPFVCNSRQKKYVEILQEKFGKKFTRLDEKFGVNYSTSAFAPFLSKGKRGIFAQYCLASTGLRAFTVWENL